MSAKQGICKWCICERICFITKSIVDIDITAELKAWWLSIYLITKYMPILLLLGFHFHIADVCLKMPPFNWAESELHDLIIIRCYVNT